MRLRTTTNCLLLAAACVFVARTPRASDDGGLSAHRAAVVAHIGPRTVSVGELEDRLAAIPRYQLRTFGDTRPAIARKFLDEIVVRDVLLSLGAEDRKIDRGVTVEQSLERTLSSATLRAISAQVGPPQAIPADEVQRYYDANKSRFDTGDRVNVWRILCETRDDALAVLEAAKKDRSAQSFTKLARDHSADKATFLRGGNLGFASDNGASNEPGVIIDPAVMKAALAVKDGELVAAPVPEGAGFAVVWRHGTVPGVHRSVDDVRAQIQDTLAKQKREAAEKALLDKLHAEKVSEVNELLLGTFDVSVDDGTLKPRMRPRETPAR